MLKEYISEHLEQARSLLSGKMKEYKTICESEKIIEDNIDKIHNTSDIDFEIFSPRMGENSLRRKINEYYEQLKEVQERKKILKQEIDEISKDLEKFRIMAAELLVLQKQAQENKK